MKQVITTLGKQYRRDLWGLRDFSLETSLRILGLLGPNGADIVKSPDTMRAVLGYLPQRRECRVLFSLTRALIVLAFVGRAQQLQT